MTRGIQRQCAAVDDDIPMDRVVKRRRQAFIMLDDEGYLLRLCRRTEWKEVGKLLSFMLHLLRQNSGESPSESRSTKPTTMSSFLSHDREKSSLGPMYSNDRSEIVQKVRQQLLAHDSNGNNCLHLICYLKPSSSRILPLLFQVARAADGVALSVTRNDHASTALMVACSSRFSRSLIHLLLRHGELNLETIVACDRQGYTPFTGLIQCYRLLSKIPSFRNRYIDLESVNASFFSTKSLDDGKLEPLEDYTNNNDGGGDEWEDEERRGSFPLLWDTCTNLILTGWHSTFPEASFCPSILHGAALVAPAMPPLLTDVMIRFYGSQIDFPTLADLIRLVIKGTTVALQKASHLSHYTMYQSQALHFVRKLLHFQPQGMELCDELAVFADIFHEAINVSLTWHLMSDNDRDAHKVDQQRGNPSSSLFWNGGNRFDSSRPWTTSNHPASSQFINSPECHEKNSIGWLHALFTLCPDALKVRDRTNGLFPFQLAALPQRNRLEDDGHCSGRHGKDPNLTLDRFQVDTIYNLLVACPDVIKT